MCPDDTHIEEACYEGYGVFDGHDIFELAAEWNREHLTDIFDDLARRYPDGFWGQALRGIAIAYQNGADDQTLLDMSLDLPPYLYREPRRTIGIAITGNSDNNDYIPYPIKIVDSHDVPAYADLHPSHNCQ